MLHLEVEGFITVEDQDKTSQLVTQSFHRLRLSGSSRSCRANKESRSTVLFRER